MPVINKSASNALLLTQSAQRIVVGLKSVPIETINFQQFININALIKTTSDSLILTQNAIHNNLLYELTYDIFTPTQSLSKISAVVGNATNSLTLLQTISSNIKAAYPVNTLAITQAVVTRRPVLLIADTNITNTTDVDLIGLDLSDPQVVIDAFAAAGLRESVAVKSVLNINTISYLSFAQQAAKGTFVTANNHISFTDIAEKILHDFTLSSLTLTQSVVVHSVEPVNNTLALTQVLSSSGVVARNITNSLALDNIVTFYNINTLCSYAPGVGAGPAAPSMLTPTLLRRSTVLFTYPYVNPTNTLTLRNPQFDDNRQLEFRKINRKSRGGTLKIYRDSIWPSSERLIYSFDNLKEGDKKLLLLFLEESLGKEIGLLDYQSRQWRGIILTPTTQIGNEDRPGNSVTIEFEGTIDPGGLFVNINAGALITADATDIPPGLQAAINVSSALVGNVLRD